MNPEELPTTESAASSRRMTASSRPPRPWLLIAAALLLAILSTVLWVKWRESRTRVDQLQGELIHVYAEAETLRTQATRSQQRIAELERELRELSPGEGIARPKPRAKTGVMP